MFGWFRKRPAPLSGAPAVPRRKTYAAYSGYVYEYRYAGRRETAEGTEYVFEASTGGETLLPVSVFVPDDALAGWESERDRKLADNERYAIAKLALFQAFDERAHPREMRRPVRLLPADLDAILETLGIE